MNATGSIVDVVQNDLAANDLKLPIFNRTALELQRLMGQGDFSMEQCAALISKDQTLASQVLREANSSFYSGLKKITTIRDAMVRLGAKEVLRLTMLVTQQSQYVCRHPGLKGLMDKLWRHSLGVGMSAYWLAKKIGYDAQAQEAFLGGLLHDIGELFLLKVLDEMVVKGRLRQLSEALVREILESMHVEQGFLLMQKWELPEIYCNVARLHHTSGAEGTTTLLLLVQLGDQACYRLGIGRDHDPDLVLATSREAQALDVRETTLAELEIMLEDKFFPKQAQANQ